MTKKQIPKKTEQPIKGGLCALPFRWSESRESKKNPREKKNDGLQAAWNSGRERTKSGCLLSSRVPRDALASYFFPGFFFFLFLLTFHDRHRRKRGNAPRLNHRRRIQTASYEPVIKQILSAHVHILKYRQGKLTFRVSWWTRFSSFNTT